MSTHISRLKRFESVPAVVNGTECEIYNTVCVSVKRRISGTNPHVSSVSGDVSITLVGSDETPEFITRECEKVIRSEYPNVSFGTVLPEMGIRVIDLHNSDEYSVREDDLYDSKMKHQDEDQSFVERVRVPYWER